jgi:hypothetical protein
VEDLARAVRDDRIQIVPVPFSPQFQVMTNSPVYSEQLKLNAC